MPGSCPEGGGALAAVVRELPPLLHANYFYLLSGFLLLLPFINFLCPLCIDLLVCHLPPSLSNNPADFPKLDPRVLVHRDLTHVSTVTSFFLSNFVFIIGAWLALSTDTTIDGASMLSSLSSISGVTVRLKMYTSSC